MKGNTWHLEAQHLFKSVVSPQLKDTSRYNKTRYFHSELGIILRVAQIFGLLPVHGIGAGSPKGLSLKRNSILGWWSFLLMSGTTSLALLSVVHAAKSLRSETFTVLGGLGAATAGAVFYSNASVAALFFWRLAAKWRPLMLQWAAVERRLRVTSKPPLASKARSLALACTVLVLATLEHGLSISTHSKSDSWLEWLEKYSLSSHGFIFSSVPYSLGVAIFVQVISRVATFTWNFTDLFLMLFGQALTTRFDQFNQSLRKKPMRYDEWREAREQYAELANLTRRVDAELSSLVFLSFANNLYFICLQLLNGLSPITGEKKELRAIYFWASFLFLLSRTAAVTLFLSNVHVASRKGMPELFSCPSYSFCPETERLLDHMSSDNLALSGLGLFYVTRSFLLAVAGAIATYEVVLLQFNVAITQPPVVNESQHH